MLLDRRSKTFDAMIKEHNVLVDGVEIPLAPKGGMQGPEAARFSQECAHQCEFLKVNSDFTSLVVPLEQRAAALGIEVDATLLRIFGAVREHFGEEPEATKPALRARHATPGSATKGRGGRGKMLAADDTASEKEGEEVEMAERAARANEIDDLFGDVETASCDAEVSVGIVWGVCSLGGPEFRA